MARHAVEDFLKQHPDELPTSRNAPPAPKPGFDVVSKYYDENMTEVTDAKGNKAWMPVEDGGIVTCCSGHTHRIHMRNSDPGRYFDDAGHEVSEEVAATMGFDVDRYRTMRRERDTLARARESVAALRGEPAKGEAPKPSVDELRAKAAKAVQELERKPWVNQPSYVMLPNEKMNRHEIKAQSTPTKWLDENAKPLDPEVEMIRKVREAGQG
jgi:hypothetical protein